MRLTFAPIFALLALATACSAPPPPSPVQSPSPPLEIEEYALVRLEGDARTPDALAVRRAVAPAPADSGQDPLITVLLGAPDGRTMELQEANHAPYDVMAQGPGGPLAAALGAPATTAALAYTVIAQEGEGGPLFCDGEGPVRMATAALPDGTMVLAGLTIGAFPVAQTADGGEAAQALPEGAVCARAVYQVLR